MGLTTHILDTSNGKPAGGVVVELWDRSGNKPTHLGNGVTNADGRLDAPIISKEEMRTGTFELRFHIGDYFKTQGQPLPSPLFLDIIPIVFGIADADAHYHVPLLVSPYGYSTYRGS